LKSAIHILCKNNVVAVQKVLLFAHFSTNVCIRIVDTSLVFGSGISSPAKISTRTRWFLVFCSYFSSPAKPAKRGLKFPKKKKGEKAAEKLQRQHRHSFVSFVNSKCRLAVGGSNPTPCTNIVNSKGFCSGYITSFS
jgi:hypothetical protein